jgi:putative transcriptional regulator
VAGDVHLVDLDADPDDLVGRVRGLRVFAGYAGWSPGQLAGEIGEGAWACVPGSPDDVLSELAGPELWRGVMGRQTGRLAVLSTAPADPTVN